MGVLGWLVLGFVAGAIAKLLHRGPDPGGLLATIAIGVLGAIVGGLIALWLMIGRLGDFFDVGTWIIAIIAAPLLLSDYRAVTDSDRSVPGP